jgi:hypothetical protein
MTRASEKRASRQAPEGAKEGVEIDYIRFIHGDFDVPMPAEAQDSETPISLIAFRVI